MEDVIMSIILNAGDARAKSLMALRSARLGDFAQAEEHLKKASESMVLAHEVQTELIRKELAGEEQELTLLMIHAQDHLMTAMAIKDMVCELVDYAKSLSSIVIKRKEELGD